jgi:hypothetical protein
LKKVLPKIINVDQTEYVKHIFICFNLRQIQDLSLEAMNSTDKTNNKADKGHLCRIPLVFLIISETQGVCFGNNKEECEQLNWENKIDKMNTLFFSWGK